MDEANAVKLGARYSAGAMILHWLIAILIALNLFAGWFSTTLEGPARYQILSNHKSFGIIILLLTVARILWRLTHPAPPLLDTLKAWEAAVAKVTHFLFYALMLAVPMAGWAYSSSFLKGAPVEVFKLFNFPGLPFSGDKATTALFAEVHETLAWLMLALMVLHILAALKHAFVDRDGTLRRMVPFLK